MNEIQSFTRPRWARFIMVIVWAFLLPMAASACPLCNTETGQQVRAGIFGEDFWPTMLTVLSPFPVLLIVLAAMHFCLDRMAKRASSRNHS